MQSAGPFLILGSTTMWEIGSNSVGNRPDRVVVHPGEMVLSAAHSLLTHSLLRGPDKTERRRVDKTQSMSVGMRGMTFGSARNRPLHRVTQPPILT